MESRSSSNLGRIFQRTVERHPDSIALVDRATDERYTYERWDERVATAASALESYGIEPQDRVGFLLGNREEYATLFWATQLTGATFVPLNVRSAPGKLADVITNVDLELLFFSASTRDLVLSVVDAIELDAVVFLDEPVPNMAVGFDSFLDRATGEFEPTFLPSEATSYVLHTSGTTGQSKPVPHSHLSAYTTPTVIAFEAEWDHGDSILPVLPLYHMAGLQTLTVSVLCNGTWIAQRDTSVHSIVETIRSEEPTYLYSVPTVYHDLVNHDDVSSEDVAPIRKVMYAGAIMTETLQRGVMELFDFEEFINYYGCTEMHNLGVCTYLEDKPTCAGRACLDTRLHVVDPTTNDPEETVTRGELGEVVADASSTGCFDGYIGRPDANERALRDGWYFTGDLGYFDEDGDLWLVGRVDDMIISGGENIYPITVEETLERHDLVADVAVAGLDHEKWGTVVTAFMVIAAADEETDFETIAAILDEHCRETETLPDYKRPRNYVFVSEIPKSSVGKKLRDRLPELTESRDAVVVSLEH